MKMKEEKKELRGVEKGGGISAHAAPDGLEIYRGHIRRCIPF